MKGLFPTRLSVSVIDGGEDSFLLQWACLEASIPAFEKQRKTVIIDLAVILEPKDIIMAVCFNGF
jgi:hypothetical protein